jgi:hypothetical protein
MRPTVIKIAAWGDRYVQSMRDNILPCLFASDNLPALCATSLVELVIYSNEAQFSMVPTLSTLTVTMAPVWEADDANDLPANREVLAATDADSVDRAIASGADWFGFQADTLISNGFLPRVKKLLQTNLAVAGAPVRTCTERFSRMVGARRDFTSKDLRRLSMLNLHPVTFDYFVREPPTTIPADPHQFFFRAPDGLVARTWQPCPYGISLEGLVDIEEGVTIDCHLITRLPPEKVHFQKSGDAFCLTSLDALAGIPTFGEFEVSVSGIVASMRKFAKDERDLRAYARALDQRFIVFPHWIADDGLDERATVEAIQAEVLT